MKSEATGIARLFNAFKFSVKGFKATYQTEEAFRQEVWLSAVLMPLAYVIAESRFEFLALIGVLFLVLIVEVLNSAVESVVDRIGSEFHELSGRAKDQGSLAVLLAVGFAVIVWGVILLG